MKPPHAPLALLALTLLFAVDAAAQNRRSPPTSYAAGKDGAICTGSPTAAAAGLDVLKNGGNAADAAVTALLVQSVLESRSFCFGSEVPVLFYDAKRKVTEVVAGQGVAPRLATEDFYNKHRKGVIRGRGDVATAAVPAFLDAVTTMLARYGTLTFAKAAAPMLKALDGGRRQWSRDLAVTIRRLIDAEKKGGGDRLRGLRLVSNYFYRGPIARELDAWSRKNGGLLRFTDLATHVTRIEEPVSIEWRGHRVLKCGFWTQGPALLQTLRLLDGYELEKMEHNGPDYIHLVTEAMKLAFADRDTYYADPLFEKVPEQALLSADYAAIRRKLIDPKKASLTQRPGDPLKSKALLQKAPRDYKVGAPMDDDDTTTCLVVDRWGNVVAATPSGWGGVLAGKTGIQLGSRLISLNVWGKHPNTVAPGKRPRITLTPTIVLKNDKPIYAVSVAGGDMQDQATLHLLLNSVVFGFDVRKAVSTGRFVTKHMWNSFGQMAPSLGSLTVPRSVGDMTHDELLILGHKVRFGGSGSAPVMLFLDPKTGIRHAAGDPRASRSAAAY